MRSHKCRRLAVEKHCVEMPIVEWHRWQNQHALTLMSTNGRRETSRQDAIVDSRPLGLGRRTVQTLQAPHRTLQAPHRRQQPTLWRKAWQMEIHSQVTLSDFDTLEISHRKSQATHPVMEDLLAQMGVKWSGCRGYGVNWLHQC